MTTNLTINWGRSCFECKLYGMYYFQMSIENVLKYSPTNLNTNDAPAKRVDIYTVLASACLEFKAREDEPSQ